MTDSEQADLVSAAVTAVTGVAALHPGMFGEVATYLPGRRVPGIRVRADGVTEIHVTLLYGVPVRDTAVRVCDAASAVAAGVVEVTVEDVVAAPVSGSDAVRS